MGGGVLGRGTIKTNSPEVSRKSLRGGSIQPELRVCLGVGGGRWQWRLTGVWTSRAQTVAVAVGRRDVN